MKKNASMKPFESRNEAALNILGDRVNVLLAGRDTRFGMCILEDWTEPLAGPPLHRHTREDEWFYILEGQFRFEIDGEMFQVGPGGSAHAGRGVAHTFQNIGATPGRMLVVTQPSGLDAFCEDLTTPAPGMGQSDLAIVMPGFERYGLELLGPPLSARGR